MASAKSRPNHSAYVETAGFLHGFDMSNIRLGPLLTTVLTKDMDRRILAPLDMKVLKIEEINWIDILPCLSPLPLLSKLVLKDLPLRSIPSLAPLSNLLDLSLIDLVDMEHLPLGIGNAPVLRSLILRGLIELQEFSTPLIDLLSSGLHPRRIRHLLIEKCGCRVPDEISKLVGIEDLWLEDSMDSRGTIIFPEIGRTLTALRNLTVIGYECLGALPSDMSGLTSLVRLKVKNVGLHNFTSSIGQLTALRQLILVNVDVEVVPEELGYSSISR